MHAGTGEFHLDVYIERIRREYGVSVEVIPPKVGSRFVRKIVSAKTSAARSRRRWNR